MKPTSKIVIFILAILTSMASAQTQSPREQLNQLVEQLQKTPTDNALREKIIKLAQTVKPAPAVPDEVQRRMARGRAAFMGAKSAADYQDAVNEFEQATLAAPWYGDAYYNLGVAQDKAEQYDAALRSLKLAQLTSLDSKEIKDLIYQVEYRNEKANSPAAREARRIVEERLRPNVEGEWSQVTEGPDMGFRVGREGERFVISSYKFLGRPTSVWYAQNAMVDQQHVRFTVEYRDTCEPCRTIFDLSLSASGRELTGTWSQPPHSTKQNAKFTRVP